MLPDVDANTLFVPNIERYLPILQELESRRGLARLDKLPKASRTHRLTLDRFLEDRANHKVVTSQGILTFDAISTSEKIVSILLYSDSRIVANYDGSDIFVPLGEPDAFELAVYLRAKRKDYMITYVPSEGEFEAVTQQSRWNYHYKDNNYDSTANLTVNLAYHLGLAVKDERLRKLFFAAGQDASPPQLEKLLNFCLEADKRLSPLRKKQQCSSCPST
jgi:hypothetical protein